MSQRPRRPAVIASGPARRSRAMHDLALQEIGAAIVRGDYPVGSLLPSKEQLMAQLKVSHTTLREALQTLTAKGLIVARARVGTRVLEHAHWHMFDADVLAWRLESGMPHWMLSMLLEIRQSIEPLAAALAATHHSEADLARLRGLLDHMRDYPGRGIGFVEADVSFHRTVLEMSGNAFIASLASLTVTALAASFRFSAPQRSEALARLVHAQHVAIADAIEARDPQAAGDAMMAAIRQGWTNAGGDAPDPLVRLALLSFPSEDKVAPMDPVRPSPAARAPRRAGGATPASRPRPSPAGTR